MAAITNGGMFRDILSIAITCRFRSMQCPVKHTCDEDLCRWSRWVESVRKDVECTFGILKGRFRILKMPVLLQSKDDIDNVFWTCCVLHNIILRSDNRTRLWEEGVDWEGEYGHHDIADVGKEFRVHRVVDSQWQRVQIRVNRALDLSIQTSFVAASSEPTEIHDTHIAFRNKLVSHFTKKYRAQEVIWQ
jgi:hypothetical protein